MTHNPRAGLPPVDMSRPFNAVGGLWLSTDKKGRDCLKGEFTIAGVTFKVLCYPPMSTSNENAPEWVVSVATADIAEFETRLDELRNPAGQMQFPF